MVNLVFILIICAGIGLFVYRVFYREKLIRGRVFPPAWEAMLTKNLPVYCALPAEDQARLQQLIHLFLEEKSFYGCGGLEMTDEIRVTVAGEACLLLLNQGRAVYPKLMSVLVYPDAFRAQRDHLQEDGTVTAASHNLLGESWSNGKVILSWDDITRGARDFTDGHNVVLHEFAHQLDSASGSSNGAPPLRHNSYQSWSRVFSENFADLQQRSQKRQPTVMDSYGTSNPAEFFAVATEAFFEKPHDLYEHRPELFQELQQYYQLDPRPWHEAPN